MTRIGVVVFPGSNCDRDTLRGFELAGAEAVPLWHEQGSLDGAAAVVLPGGFAYGDYLRAGVIARFSPVMRAVSAFAADGGLVLGICNGFQVIAEAGLVPGALLRNRGLRFLGRDVHITAEQLDTPFTALIGDYLRAGVIARFSPVMRAVSAFAADGGLVLGICNGFQVIAEAGLVPGALLRNRGLRFLGRDVHITAEQLDTPFTALIGDGRPLRMPIAHGEGCYYADDAELDALERDGQVLFRYVRADGTRAGVEGDPANPNGSLRAIAGVRNARGNVAGLMPHPERASDAILGSDDGLPILRSLVEAAAHAERGAEPVAVGGR